jgi:hypothetical protein
MDNRTLQSNVELRIKRATEWLKASQIDYDAYRKLVRCTWFPLIQCKPTNPQPAIVILQRSIEKLVKAVAIASGKYSYEDILNWSHDSFGLYLDIQIKMVEAPVMKLLLDNVQGPIFKQSKARFFSQNESLRRLNELKTRAKLGSARKEMGEWAYELSTLPEEVVSQLVKSQLRAIRWARILAVILNHIPLSLYSKFGHSSGELSSTLLRSFEK